MEMSPVSSRKPSKLLYDQAQGKALVLLSAILEEGGNYGRVVRDETGAVKEIVEARDCTPEQKEIREINAGVYCFNNRDLFECAQRADNR